MDFKEWLILQESSETNRRRTSTYPAEADGYSKHMAVMDFKDFRDKVKNTVYSVSVGSRSLPSNQPDEVWKHKEDNPNIGDVKIETLPNELRNIDKETVARVPIINVTSRSLPSNQPDGVWKHKKDNGQSSIGISYT